MITRKGFTLIELMVVISIISLLSSIVLGSVTAAKSKANIAKMQSDMNEIKNAAALFQSDHSQYPTQMTDIVPTYLTVEPVSPFGYSRVLIIYGIYTMGLETASTYYGTETPEIGRFYVTISDSNAYNAVPNNNLKKLTTLPFSSIYSFCSD